MRPDIATGASPADRFAGQLAAARRMVAAAIAIEMCAAMSLTVAIVGATTWAAAREFPRSHQSNVVAIAAMAVVVGLAWAWRRGGDLTRAAIAAQIEAVAPHARNVVVTAEQLTAGNLSTSPALEAWIIDDACGIVAAARPRVVNRRRAVIVLAVAVTSAALSAVMAIGVRGPTAIVGASRQPAPAVADGSGPAPEVRVRVVPPDYLRRDSTTMTNPTRLEVPEGSRLHLSASGDVGITAVWLNGRGLASHTPGAPVTLAPVDDGSIVVELGGDGRPERRALPLAIIRDPVPVVTVVTPGRDLVVDNISATFEVRLTARDDQSLASLRLRYTKVSGSGEQFEFVEGELPVLTTASSPLEWAGRATLDLGAHRLVAGDLIAYRAVARDRRPSGGEGTSDTFVVRVAQPGDVASAGFAIDEDENRFALSQQMLLVKTERLDRERLRLAADEYASRASGLAVEQRMIRNEFSFMVGGEVEDEEEEAAHSHELQEGRDDNRGRRDVLAAIRAMSRAEQWLLRANSHEALPHVREAVEALQRAFSRTRYLLRTLPIHARIDLERRLSGDPQGSQGVRMPAPPATARERVAATLASIAEIDRTIRDGHRLPPDERRRHLVDIATRIATLDPRSAAVAEAARLVLDAGRASAGPGADLLAGAASLLADDTRRQLAPPLGGPAAAAATVRPHVGPASQATGARR